MTATGRSAGRPNAATLPPTDDVLTILAPEDRYPYLLGLVRVETAILLGRTDPSAVPADSPFDDLGLTSLTAVVLPRRLSRVTGISLPGTLVTDYRTPDAVAALLHAELFGDPLPDLLASIDGLWPAAAQLSPGGRDQVVARLRDLLAELGDDLPADHPRATQEST